MQLNRKGQSLVLFVLLIPIMIGFLALVVDVGNASVEKNNIDNVIFMIMDMALDKKIDSSEIKEYMDDNLKNYQNIVTISGDEFVIESSTYVKGVFSKIFGFNGFSVKSKYYGTVRDGKKIIEKR